MSNPTLLVTGASGHLGRRVLELLLESQSGQVMAVTRHPEKLADFAQRGVLVRQGDFDVPENLIAAFTGADRVLIISTDVVGESGRRLKQHVNAVQAAEKAGVSHVVYTSLTNPEAGTPVVLAPDHYGTEQALAQSSLGWTVLRNNIYADGLLFTLGQALKTGVLTSAAGDGKAAYVTREDCARAAAAALASAFTGQRTLDITGPVAYSQGELAQIATQLTGTQVNYVPATAETIIGYMVQAGLPRSLAEAYVSFDVGIAQGFFSRVSHDLAELTEHAPMSAAEFLAAHLEALVSAN